MPVLAAAQAINLCWNDSQMQAVFKRIASMNPNKEDSQINISYAAVIIDVAVHLIGWASVSLWKHEGLIRREVQAFVEPKYRGKGIGYSLVVCVADNLTSEYPIAVFSPECFKIGKRMRWNVERYTSEDGKWISVEKQDFRLLCN